MCCSGKKSSLLTASSKSHIRFYGVTLPKIRNHSEKNYTKLLESAIADYSKLKILHKGDSREIRELEKNEKLVISKLLPNVYSLLHNGAIEVKGSDLYRAKLNQYFCELLHKHGVATTTISHTKEYVLMHKKDVANIEIIVKSRMSGSPKHTYKGIDKYITRENGSLQHNEDHQPYVRFDWRCPESKQDITLPDDLAKYFIDINLAKSKALKAFNILHQQLLMYDFKLIDCCFFMDSLGKTICAEVSPDNLGNIIYNGKNKEIQKLFKDPDKIQTTNKLYKLCKILNLAQ